MPKIDLSITISVIIAICAIISPIITTLLNNHHLYKMRKLDDEAELRKSSYFFKRGIYEDYLRYTSQYIASRSRENLCKYAEIYGLALIYFPDELRDKIIDLHTDIMNPLCEFDLAKFDALAPLIRIQLQKM